MASMATKVLTIFEFVHRAAIRALGLAGMGHIKVHLGVAVPDFHIGQRAWAEHATLMVEVFGEQFDGCVTHGFRLS